MGTSKDILTQNDLIALNDQLSRIGTNLKLHVNESLSIAHGMNAVVANYYDSAGDKFGNVVLVFDFGTPPNVVRLFVPAQVTVLDGQIDQTGFVAAGDTPAGSFNSPGVPLGSKSLVTEMSIDAANQSEVYSNILLAHAQSVAANTGAAQCHGGTSYTIGNVTDSRSHVVGRRYITLGIDGLAWKIPADVFSENSGTFGPPQLIRGVNLLANKTLKHNVAAMGRDDDQYCAFWLTDPTGGTGYNTGGYTVEWSINQKADGSSAVWNLMNNTAPGYHTAVTDKYVQYDISQGAPPGTYSILLHASEGSDNRKLQCTVRAKITNVAGSVFTNYCRFYANDEDGCSFLGLITFSDPDTNSNTWYESIPGSPAIK